MKQSAGVEQTKECYVQVILPRPLAETYTYRILTDEPEKLIGQWVLVPLGKEQILGCIFSLTKKQHIASHKVKDILIVFKGVQKLPFSLLQLIEKLAHYYFVPIGEALRLVLPRWVAQTTYIYQEQKPTKRKAQGQFSFLEPAQEAGPSSCLHTALHRLSEKAILKSIFTIIRKKDL